MMKKILFLAVALFLIFSPVYGAIGNFSVTKGTTYIKWSWDNTEDNHISEITIDGINSYYNRTFISMDNQQFLLSDLQPDSIHTILLKDKIGEVEISVFNETNTSMVQQTKQESTFDFIFSYIWLILAVILIAIAALARNEFISYLAVFVSLIGFLKSVADKSFMIYMLYLFMIIVSYFSADSNRG